jgi:hypothetical protein
LEEVAEITENVSEIVLKRIDDITATGLQFTFMAAFSKYAPIKQL